MSDLIWGIIGVFVAVGILIMFFLIPCPGCGKLNSRKSSQCRACRTRLES